MIAVKDVLVFLKKNGATPFDKIWKSVKLDVIEGMSTDLNDENSLKADLHLSMTSDSRIIMVGKNIWDLANSYSHEEKKQISEKVLGEELEKVTLTENDTHEIKLEIETIIKEGNDDY